MKLFFLLLGGWLVFAAVRLLVIFPWAPHSLLAADELVPCELIVFLDGEYYERIDYAFDLAESGYADKVFVAHISYEESEARLAERLAAKPERIQFYRGSGAASTFDEALGARRFVESKGIKTVVLVTSNYHSKRAAWIYRKVMPRIKIVSAPVPFRPDELHAETNEVREDSRLYRYLEYEQPKFVAYYLMYGLNPFATYGLKGE